LFLPRISHHCHSLINSQFARLNLDRRFHMGVVVYQMNIQNAVIVDREGRLNLILLNILLRNRDPTNSEDFVLQSTSILSFENPKLSDLQRFS
ncbi:hypothetical protein PENTCL1PPCAC_7983, partial [Pristionchus entomophagus]